MVESEEFLQEIHTQLSASDKHVNKEALRNYLLVPGEERLQLICWALSEMNIVIKNHGNAFFLSLLVDPIQYLLFADYGSLCDNYVTDNSTKHKMLKSFS
jgi:hypothetical protein